MFSLSILKVTNESTGTSAKTATITDEKQQTQQTSSTSNSTTKYSSNKANISSNESKRSKTSGVIPSKDKSLNNSQNIITTSSTPLPPPEKPIICSSNNKQFTDLFGTPIQARPPSDSSSKSKVFFYYQLFD